VFGNDEPFSALLFALKVRNLNVHLNVIRLHLLLDSVWCALCAFVVSSESNRLRLALRHFGRPQHQKFRCQSETRQIPNDPDRGPEGDIRREDNRTFLDDLSWPFEWRIFSEKPILRDLQPSFADAF